MVELRDYQKAIIVEIFQKWKECRAIMLQMPTGTGKTTVFSEIIKRQIKFIEPNRRVLVLVHRKELVDQIIGRLKNFGIVPGVIMADRESDILRQVQVASVQTLVRRFEKPKNISLVIVDEAHHVKANSYLNILHNYKDENTKLLGVTATPCRTNGEGFSDVFDELVTSMTIKDFIDKKYLAEIRHFVTSTPDLSRMKIDPKTNDYDIEMASGLMSSEIVMADLIESYQKYAPGKKSLVFAVSRFHASKIVERFRSVNVKADFIDAETPTEDRARIVADFRNGKITVLSNVNIFTEGFDCPDVEVVQLARPTKSLILYMQQVGRVMRPKPDGKPGLVLDNACIWKEHGLITRDRTWILDGKIKQEVVEVIPRMNYDTDSSQRLPYELKGLELIEITKKSAQQLSPFTQAYIKISDRIIKLNIDFGRKDLDLADIRTTAKTILDNAINDNSSEKISLFTKELTVGDISSLHDKQNPNMFIYYYNVENLDLPFRVIKAHNSISGYTDELQRRTQPGNNLLFQTAYWAIVTISFQNSKDRSERINLNHNYRLKFEFGENTIDFRGVEVDLNFKNALYCEFEEGESRLEFMRRYYPGDFMKILERYLTLINFLADGL